VADAPPEMFYWCQFCGWACVGVAVSFTFLALVYLFKGPRR